MLLKNFLVCGNGILSAHAKPTNKEKLFLSMAKLQLSTAPKLTCSHKFHLRKPYCELAAKHPFFETSQSCVSSTASISHRFKAFSPPFCAKNRFRLVPPEAMLNFLRQSFESSPGVQRAAALGVFLWYFLHAAKSTNPYSLAGSFEVFQTSNQPTTTTTSHEQN